ncbi:unnamed protein product, partial [Prorocentrum cordatum]
MKVCASELHKGKIEAKYGLVDYMFTTRKILHDVKLQNKFEHGEKEEIVKVVQDTPNWLEKPKVADVVVFEGKRTELDSIAGPIVAKAFGRESCKVKLEDGGEEKHDTAVHDTLFWVNKPQLADTHAFQGKQEKLGGIVNPIVMKAYQGSGDGAKLVNCAESVEGNSESSKELRNQVQAQVPQTKDAVMNNTMVGRVAEGDDPAMTFAPAIVAPDGGPWSPARDVLRER